MRLLTLDIETLPHEAYVWGLFDQNISLSQLKKPGTIACWAAKFHGEKPIHFASAHERTERAMLKEAHDILSEADAVIGWNSTPFDVRWLQGQFLKHRLPPTKPFKQIDLLRTWRQQFRTASNKLEYAATFLGLRPKVKTGGFELWRDCANGDERAWAKMKRYNIQDVRLTEEVYDILRPWVKNHPNVGAFDARTCCPKCGSKHVISRGKYITRDRAYPQFSCKSCFTWLYQVSGALQQGIQVMRTTT